MSLFLIYEKFSCCTLTAQCSTGSVMFTSQRKGVHYIISMSGYPAPELKWYKDDMEMDRYCGLPKYEIRRNGKTHTLHIYKYVRQACINHTAER